jgi:hypothetical protein
VGPGIGSGAWGSRSRSPALWCFLIALALFVSYASMDPSVDARLGGRVNNMGLLFGKWFGSMLSAQRGFAGMALVVTGALITTLGARRDSLR